MPTLTLAAKCAGTSAKWHDDLSLLLVRAVFDGRKE
jgi:hypothetical protein